MDSTLEKERLIQVFTIDSFTVPPSQSTSFRALRVLAAFERSAVPLRQIGRGFIGGLQEIEQSIVR